MVWQLKTRCYEERLDEFSMSDKDLFGEYEMRATIHMEFQQPK